MKAVKDGLKHLEFEPADAHLKYRFRERKRDHASLLQKGVRRGMQTAEHRTVGGYPHDSHELWEHQSFETNQPTLNYDNWEGSLSNRVNLYDISGLIQRTNSTGIANLKKELARFLELPIGISQQKSVYDYPNLEDSGLYNRRSIWDRIKLAFTEPAWLMRSITFPEVAYQDVKRLELVDDLAAASGEHLDLITTTATNVSGTVDPHTALGRVSNCVRDYLKPCPEGSTQLAASAKIIRSAGPFYAQCWQGGKLKRQCVWHQSGL